MKIILSTLCLMMLIRPLMAQDIDFYHVQQDDLLKTSYMAYGMNLDEYQLLTRNLRMKDMMYAMVVPGYVHFRANENKTGYYILGLRVASLGALTAVGVQTAAKLNDIYNLRFDEAFDKHENPIFVIANSTVVILSMSTIMATYMYDWIHGQHMLNKKQELYRYKYNLKFNIENTPGFLPQNQVYPTMGIQIKF